MSHARSSTSICREMRQSFTIIAFPKPEIGPDFEDIFRETIAINTLDYRKYQKIQQKLIDALDKADRVEITGQDGNETSMKVQLHTLNDPAKQTNFENCVSDEYPIGRSIYFSCAYRNARNSPM